MSSMRRPKRLIMLGDDEQNYPWLVKGGEDLRLDQRIQQMFTIMNKIMGTDSFCVRNRISLITYKVIPMSSSLGIIEWVDGTKPLKACMSDNKGFDVTYKETQGIYQEYIKGYGKSGAPLMACFDPFLQQAKFGDVVRTMDTLYSRTHRSYLTEFLTRLSASPESFFEMRLTFANSLAALNICSYLLGIGDRHLDNFLVDLKCGQIIGIDFGHAFGSATEVLPVPELVPFRLTKQMERLMEPLGVSVMVKRPMTYVLSAIQESKDMLLNALDIFAKEPLIEWRKFAANLAKRQAKQAYSQDSSFSSSSYAVPDWYPQKKLEIAARKLNRENPIYITTDELAAGHEKKKFFKNMRSAVMGETHGAKRSQVGKVCKSAAEQVDCLIDLATDRDVLGRCWVGWSSWT
ncbi:hypothetical protein HDU97_008221 [Phlyctochytrium planicorne]|nr:hypothetical protein HDU97_008221 [Phlyctochytrium planicorne]